MTCGSTFGAHRQKEIGGLELIMHISAEPHMTLTFYNIQRQAFHKIYFRVFRMVQGGSDEATSREGLH